MKSFLKRDHNISLDIAPALSRALTLTKSAKG